MAAFTLPWGSEMPKEFSRERPLGELPGDAWDEKSPYDSVTPTQADVAKAPPFEKRQTSVRKDEKLFGYLAKWG